MQSCYFFHIKHGANSQSPGPMGTSVSFNLQNILLIPRIGPKSHWWRRNSVLASLTACLCRNSGAHWVLIPHCILFPWGSVSFPTQARVAHFQKGRYFPSCQAWLQGIISLAFKVYFPCVQYSYWIHTTFLISEFAARSKYNLRSGRWVDYWLVIQAIGSLHHSLQWYLIRPGLHIAGNFKLWQ